MLRRQVLGAGVAAGAVSLAGPLWAQAYPTKPISLVVPFPPGGLADIVARPVAEALSRELGQAVVIENKPGAGGGIGMGAVAKSKPDGYTLLMALSSLTVIPEADAILGRAPLFALGDLRPIARYTADPTVLAVRADSPWKSVQDFVEDARKRPGQIAYGSSGNYGTMHVPMEMLKASAGFPATHVPFTGAGPAVLALLGGQIDAVASGPSTVAQHIKAGKLRALGHWGDKPLQSLPEVPSLTQLGQPVKFAQWAGLFVPAGTPEDIIQKLRAASRKAAADPAVIATIGKAGSPIEYLDAPEFQAYWDADAKAMAEAVKRIGKVE